MTVYIWLRRAVSEKEHGEEVEVVDRWVWNIGDYWCIHHKA
jgi:hypothetical protein